jgi:hypothetical protein
MINRSTRTKYAFIMLVLMNMWKSLWGVNNAHEMAKF